MRLIVGLGNPGEKYKNNRHNVGHMFLDYFVEQIQMSNVKCQNYNSKFKKERKLDSEIYRFYFDNNQILIVKSLVFMNKSGLVVKKLIKKLNPPSRRVKFKIKNLFVVHDDLDLRLGEFKIQKGVGPKLHNGILSIEKELGRSDFWRVRIGVDNRTEENRIQGEVYVLQDFTREESDILLAMFEKIMRELSILQ